MLLAMDIGNTNTVIGLHNEDAYEEHFRIQSVPEKMPDEYVLTLLGLFREHGVDVGAISRVVVGSVVPALTYTMQEAIGRMTRVPVLVVTPYVRLNVAIDTPHPEEVGADLIANACAAYKRFGKNCIIVDFGTALTFVAVTREGRFLGAAFAPGLNTAMRSLSLGTAQLPQVGLEPPPAAIGENTIHALQSGIVIGYAGLAEKLITEMDAELGGGSAVIATGGLSGALAERIPQIQAVDPWLTLSGLKLIADLNR
ncbi:MAG: type III pantothenate kinase [Spirochaetaceae bacterium]